MTTLWAETFRKRITSRAGSDRTVRLFPRGNKKGRPQAAFLVVVPVVF